MRDSREPTGSGEAPSPGVAEPPSWKPGKIPGVWGRFTNFRVLFYFLGGFYLGFWGFFLGFGDFRGSLLLGFFGEFGDFGGFYLGFWVFWRGFLIFFGGSWDSWGFFYLIRDFWGGWDFGDLFGSFGGFIWNFGHFISSFAIFCGFIWDFKPILGIYNKPELFFPPSSGNSSTFVGKSTLHGASFPLKPAPSPSWSRRSPKKAPRRFLSAAEEVIGLGMGKIQENPRGFVGSGRVEAELGALLGLNAKFLGFSSPKSRFSPLDPNYLGSW